MRPIRRRSPFAVDPRAGVAPGRGWPGDVWVEPEPSGHRRGPGRRRTGTARTFSAHGHHYGSWWSTGCRPARSRPTRSCSTARRSGRRPATKYPQPAIRTRAGDDGGGAASVRLVPRVVAAHTDGFPPDALDAYAVRLWPTAPSRPVARPDHAARRPGVRRRDVDHDAAGCSPASAAAPPTRPTSRSSTSTSTPSSTSTRGPTPTSAGCSPPCPA